MTSVVVDASVALAWCFEDEATSTSEHLLDYFLTGHAVVPELWELEIANALLVAERRERITEAQSARFLQLLGQLDIRRHDSPLGIASIVAVGRTHGLSAYDASYLLVAERLAAPLATFDTKLITACHAAGVAVFAAP